MFSKFPTTLPKKTGNSCLSFYFFFFGNNSLDVVWVFALLVPHRAAAKKKTTANCLLFFSLLLLLLSLSIQPKQSESRLFCFRCALAVCFGFCFGFKFKLRLSMRWGFSGDLASNSNRRVRDLQAISAIWISKRSVIKNNEQLTIINSNLPPTQNQTKLFG